MAAHFDRREWPTVIGGFSLGFLIAMMLFALWIMLTRGSAESFQAPRVGPSDGSLVDSKYASIVRRLEAERRPIHAQALTFRATDVVWQDGKRPPFARVPEMRGRLDTRALQNKDIVVRGLIARDADVLLEQNAPDQWNYRRVLAPLLEGEDTGEPSRIFLVTDAAVQNATVRVKMPERAFAITKLSAQLPLAEFSGPQLAAPHVAIARATGMLVVRDSAHPMTAALGTATFPTGRADFTARHITIGDTHIANVDGSYGGDLPGLALRMTGDVDRMRFEDVRFLSPRLPPTGSATFGFAVRPVDAAVTQVTLSNASIESEGSRITGSATVLMRDSTLTLEAADARLDPLTLSLVERMRGDTLSYRGTLVGTARGSGGLISFDVATRLTSKSGNEPIITHLVGNARFASSGFDVRRLVAEVQSVPFAAVRTALPGLPLKGKLTGKIELIGPPGRAPLDVNVRLELASGVVLVEGKVDLTGAVPAYDLSGRLVAINMQQLLEPSVPPVLLTARFSLAGSGTAAETARARAQVIGRFTGWRSTVSDTIHLDARLENGTAYIDAASLKLASMTATAGGRWHFAAPSTGAIDYRIAFEPISPFGRFIPAFGDDDASGDVRVTGKVAGELRRAQVVGEAVASNVVVGRWSAAALQGKYSFVLGPQIPEIAIDLTGRNVKTPTAGEYQALTGKLQLISPVLRLEMRGERSGRAGGIEILADGQIPSTGPRQIVLQRARVDFGSENWALTRPAVFSWIPPGTNLNVRDFELRKSDGIGFVKFEGRLLPLANADFQLETSALPVGDLQSLLGRRERVSGALSTNTTLRATNGVPQLTSRFRLSDATVEGIKFSLVTGEASYQGQTLIAKTTAHVDTASVLQINAELPIDLRFGEQTRAAILDNGRVHISVVSDSVSLAPIARLHPDIDSVSGTLAANIQVTGTVDQPQLAGSASIRNGAIHVISLNQLYDSINAGFLLENRSVIIRDLVARSGGIVRGTGTIEFRELNKPVLDFTTRFARFQPVGMDKQKDAAVTGDIRVTGAMQAPVLTGSLTIDDGFLPIPQTGNRALDNELANFESDLPAPGGGRPGPSFYESLRIDDLKIKAGPNLWFAMEDARAQLAGNLTIDKTGDALSIVGELNGERGTYTLRAGPIIRRFDVVSARIRFLGGRDINPALDITARRSVVDLNGEQFDIEVNIRGTMQRPTLALASQEQRPISQSELLSFLLFGRPSVALGGTTITAQREIGETYIGGISELLSMELEQAFIDEMGMGLDIFQIRLGGGRLSDLDRASVVVGEEIGSNLFLTVESGIETLFGNVGGAAGAATSRGATVAVRLDWRFARNTRLRASYEPVVQSYLVRNATPLPERRYQGRIELRRRWTW